MKWAIALLFFLLLLLQFRLWVGEESVVAVWRLETAIDNQREENERLRQRNARLAAQVADLKDGLEAVEERARQELGMVGRDETYYQFVD